MSTEQPRSTPSRKPGPPHTPEGVDGPLLVHAVLEVEGLRSTIRSFFQECNKWHGALVSWGDRKIGVRSATLVCEVADIILDIGEAGEGTQGGPSA